MFERPHHRRIAAVLSALDGPLLCANACLFGGGTAIALRYGEYRESVDIDFLVCHADGYRELRQRLTGPRGIGAIVREVPAWTAARDVRADQYGIRTALQVDGHEIKFEIVREARFELAPPGSLDLLCGVATLTPLDMVTSKLLANSDRWADDGIFSRDLIDLAMMAPALDVLRLAVAKAEPAYGAAVLTDLAKAVDQLKARHGRLERCMQALQIRIPAAVLWQKILALRRRAQCLAS
jgi:Nucleotidyl transferase AbiEii toxin, Type IV TA system